MNNLTVKADIQDIHKINNDNHLGIFHATIFDNDKIAKDLYIPFSCNKGKFHFKNVEVFPDDFMSEENERVNNMLMEYLEHFRGELQ